MAERVPRASQAPAQGASKPRRRPTKHSTTPKHSTTRAAALRSGGVKLCCYLNADERASSTIVALPMDCDTIAEVLSHIQKRMQLERRMLFATELFMPTGTLIKTYAQLAEAAKHDTPIIVGCGEPFDALRVPNDLLEFHLNGGGRTAVKQVTRELKDRRKHDRVRRAERVREAGHGSTPEAAILARELHVDAMHEKADTVRQRYMEGLIARTAQQRELLNSVHQNVAIQRMEAEESRQAQRDYHRERADRLAQEREVQDDDLARVRDETMQRVQQLHDTVRAGEGQARKARGVELLR